MPPTPGHGDLNQPGRKSRAGSVRQDRGVDEDCCEVVVTDADAERLAALTRTLVEERLVACGQHVVPIRSVFRWDGAVLEEEEARVALHTRRSLVDAVVARVAELHGYDVPSVLALPVVGGNPAYLRWIIAETREPDGTGPATLLWR
jgi:periplasmic divalent cation tolerance protein